MNAVTSPLLITLNDKIEQASRESQIASLELARLLFERDQQLVKQKSIPQSQYDRSRADLDSATAQLAETEARLDNKRVVAPFSGTLGIIRAKLGDYIESGDSITTLQDLSELEIDFSVPARHAPRLKPGLAVTVTTTAFPGEVLAGTIDVIEPQLDPLTRNVNVVALVDNPDELMRPGMSATIEVVLQKRAEALTVPSDAVFVEGGQAYVYVIKPDSLVTRAPVTLGTRLAGVVEVTEGVREGDSVVKAGHQKLYEGAKVMPLTAPADDGPGQQGGNEEGQAR